MYFPDPRNPWVRPVQHTVCADLESKDARTSCEKSNATTALVVGLLGIPLAIKHGMLAIKAKTWKECAMQSAIASIIALVSGVLFISSTRVLK